MSKAEKTGDDMKVINFDFKSSFANIRKNARFSIIILIVCILIGVICGLYQSRQYQGNKDLVYRGEPEVTLADIEKNEQYYFDAFDRIKAEIDCLDIYFKYFRNVKLTNANRELLEEAKVAFDDFYEDYKSTEYYFWETALTAGDKDKTVEFYRQKMTGLEEMKEVVDAKCAEDDEDKLLTDVERKRLNDQAVYIDAYHSNFETLIALFDAPDEEILKNNEEADRMLADNVDKLNKIIAMFNSAMQTISGSENYQILINKNIFPNSSIFTVEGINFGLLRMTEDETLLNNKINNAIIYAKSVEGLDSGHERLFAMITFFTLFGIILSITFGAFHTPKERKKG
ncbi:MAG: hypothetical protein IJH43_09750 [Mogibacterium sp.]|nr:hypothetical protein [Mogibacterium sp.]